MPQRLELLCGICLFGVIEANYNGVIRTDLNERGCIDVLDPHNLPSSGIQRNGTPIPPRGGGIPSYPIPSIPTLPHDCAVTAL